MVFLQLFARGINRDAEDSRAETARRDEEREVTAQEVRTYLASPFAKAAAEVAALKTAPPRLVTKLRNHLLVWLLLQNGPRYVLAIRRAQSMYHNIITFRKFLYF